MVEQRPPNSRVAGSSPALYRLMNTLQEIFQNCDLDKETGCWNWNRSTDPSGYGSVKYNGKKYNTHRLVWILLYRKLNKDIYVCHKCDNRKCINPDHLFVGTQSDNMQDCANKNRIYRKLSKDAMHGADNTCAKISWADANKIRCLYTTGNYTYEKLGKIYGLHKTNIGRIIRNVSYKSQYRRREA